MRVDESDSPVGVQVLTSKMAWRILGERKKKRMERVSQKHFDQQAVESDDSLTSKSSESEPAFAAESDARSTANSSPLSAESKSPRCIQRSWRPFEVQVHNVEADLKDEDWHEIDRDNDLSPAARFRQHSPSFQRNRLRSRVSPCCLSQQRSLDQVQEDISRMNRLITLQSVADKADEKWKQSRGSSPEIRPFFTNELANAEDIDSRRGSRTSVSSEDSSLQQPASAPVGAMERKPSIDTAANRHSKASTVSRELSPHEKKALFRELITSPPKVDDHPALKRHTSTASTPELETGIQRLSRSRMRRWSATMYDPSSVQRSRRSSLVAQRRGSEESRRALDSVAVASDLSTLAANIPAGDPRIGELYSAAVRSFGGIAFIKP